jgi:hypothetical protein
MTYRSVRMPAAGGRPIVDVSRLHMKFHANFPCALADAVTLQAANIKGRLFNVENEASDKYSNDI